MQKDMTKLEYLNNHKSCGIMVGDKVKIVRKASSFEDGWQNKWLMEMDVYVGECGYVRKDLGVWGFCVEFEDGQMYNFPYFVLQRVSTTK